MGGRNIIIMGETGVGKSSIVNMICGGKVAKTSGGGKGCTFESTPYKDPYGDIFYDTAGFNEASLGTVPPLQAIQNVKNLANSLNGNVHLLMFVISKGRIKDTMVTNYKMFVDTICENKVPVILVVTGCEFDKYPHDWFNQNKICFDHVGLRFARVVCGCFSNETSTTTPAAAEEMKKSYVVTKALLVDTLKSPEFQIARKFEKQSWLARIIQKIKNFFGF